jgi:hypothetical protein
MKRNTIIALLLAASLVLIGAVAYGYWNDYGDQGYYGTGYGYNCGYGNVYGAGYNSNVDTPSAYRHNDRNGVPYDYPRSYQNGWNGNRYPRRYGNGWNGYGWHGMMGPRGCW